MSSPATSTDPIRTSIATSIATSSDTRSTTASRWSSTATPRCRWWRSTSGITSARRTSGRGAPASPTCSSTCSSRAASTSGTNEHFRYIQQVGGVANGSTWYDRTNYYETLPAHHLDLGLWLESDRMGFFLPALTQENLDTQRDVVMNERRQRVENQPYGRAGERLHELLYPAGPPLPLAGDRLHGGHRRRHPGGRADASSAPTTRRTTRCSRWSATSSPTTPWSGSRPGSARSPPARRCRR